MGRAKTNQGIINYVKLFLASTMAAVLSAAILLAAAALLLDKLGLNEIQFKYIVYGVYLITGFSAGFLSGKLKREKKFLWGALAGVVWFLIVFLVSLILNNMGIEVREVFPAMVCMIGGGMLGGMLA